MGAKNLVIAGDYSNRAIGQISGVPYIVIGMFKSNLYLNKDNVDSYELITDEHRKSASSGIARGAVGVALLGPVGLLAGLSAKNKGIYTIAIKFKDGCNSLIEVDDKIYKSIVKGMF